MTIAHISNKHMYLNVGKEYKILLYTRFVAFFMVLSFYEHFGRDKIYG